MPAVRPAAGRQRRAPDRARRVAFDALRRVSSEGAYANLVLPQLLTERRIGDRDAAFATELLAGTCRGQGTYDVIIAAAADRKLSSWQPALLDLLRLGAHQILAMRVPAHAAVAATVDLAAATVGERVTGLVNAVLRRVAAETLDDLAGSTRGGTRRPRSARSGDRPSPVDRGRVRRPAAGRGTGRGVAGRQRQPAGRPGRPAGTGRDRRPAGCGRRARRAVAVRRRLARGNPDDLELVRTGRAGVQDEGSQLVAWALTRIEAPPGRWLDLCAGPGGKTALLAGLAEREASSVLATELAPHRAMLVRQAIRAYQRPPTVIVADGTRPAWRPGSFARVLVDAPCTGLGALRRRPDPDGGGSQTTSNSCIRSRWTCSGRRSTAPPRGEWSATSPAPRTVGRPSTWSTETLAGREDVQVIPAADLLPEVPDAADGDYLQLWPHRHGTDAMFAAYLRRS